MILFTRNVQNRQIHRDSKLTAGCEGLGSTEEWDVNARVYEVALGGDETFWN